MTIDMTVSALMARVEHELLTQYSQRHSVGYRLPGWTAILPPPKSREVLYCLMPPITPIFDAPS